MKEEWREIEGYGGKYEVSNLGRVRSLRFINGHVDRLREIPKILSSARAGKRYYPAVVLCLNGKNTPKLVHTLVLTAFVGPRPAGMVCCHADGNYHNPVLSNLRWDTDSANKQDAVRHGTAHFLPGMANPNVRLSDDDVRCIRAEPSFSGVNVMLAKAFGVSKSLVKQIRYGIHRANVPQYL